MPIIEISLTEQTAEVKAELSKTMTNDLHRITGIKKEAIIVLIHEYPAENICSGGQMLNKIK